MALLGQFNNKWASYGPISMFYIVFLTNFRENQQNLSRDKLKVKKNTEFLMRQLAFENVNEDCQLILHSIRERGDVMDF